MDIRNSLAKFYEYLERPIFLSARGIMIGLAGALVVAFTLPIWRISMEAPQYPDGLYMDVWTHKLEGGNDGQHITEINTLNHYIGMHTIDTVATADLEWLPFALGALVLVLLRAAVIGNIRALLDATVLSLYVSGFAFARFVYRLWVFGHNLAPDAPMKIEPFMPVVLGTKQVANFTTHSWPRVGSLFLAIAVLGLLALTVWHLVAGRIAYVRSRRAAAA